MNGRDWHDLPAAAKEQALDWHVRLTSGAATDADYAAFGAWIAAVEDNAAAYEFVERADARIEAAKPASPPKRRVLRPTRSTDIVRLAAKPRYAAIAATLAAIVMVGFFSGPRLFPARSAVEEFASVEGPKSIMLADGSEVILAPGARMKAQFSRRRRQVVEFQGVGYFHVAKDENRPFSIALEHHEVTVVGTQFEVRSFPAMRSVSVVQGVVQLSGPAQTKMSLIRLTAGETATIRDDVPGPPAVSKTNANDIASWRDGALEFDGAPISTVIAALNGLYGGDMFVDATSDGTPLKFNGVLQVTMPELVAKRLQDLLPVIVERENGRYAVTNAQGSETNRDD